MTVLLTNDDGFDSEGIKTLKEVFSTRHEVWIMAPVKNHSGASCCLSITNRIEVFKKGKNEYALLGTPVDCVLNALTSNVFPHRPDVVLSGINSDSNLGTDVLYSGTCGAARQASSFGVPGIALSIRNDYSGKTSQNYASLANFALENLDRLVSLCQEKYPPEEGGHYKYYLNINAPVTGPYRGVRFATLSKRHYGDTVRVLNESDERLFIDARYVGEQVKSLGDGTEDSAAVDNGMIAISMLYTEPQCYYGGGTWQDRTH